MNVVGIHIVLGAQHGRATQQAFARMTAVAVRRVDAGDAQDRNASTMRPAVPAHASLGIDTAARPVRGRVHRAGLVETRATAIAVDAGGAAVNDAAHSTLARQRVQQVSRARIGVALQRRWCQMQHRIGQPGQSRKGCRFVEVADQRHRTGGAQFGGARRAGGQRQQSIASLQQAQHPHADISATDDQQHGTLENEGQCGHGQRAAESAGRIPPQFTFRVSPP